MPCYIFSVAFSSDNQSAFMTDGEGNIKMIKWKAGASSGDDFDFNQEPTKLIGYCLDRNCLTKDKKYLLVASLYSLSIFETETKKVTKEFKLPSLVRAITLIKDGKQAIIAEDQGDLSILDLETLEISSIAEKITNDRYLNIIIVI